MSDGELIATLSRKVLAYEYFLSALSASIEQNLGIPLPSGEDAEQDSEFNRLVEAITNAIAQERRSSSSKDGTEAD